MILAINNTLETSFCILCNNTLSDVVLAISIGILNGDLSLLCLLTTWCWLQNAKRLPTTKESNYDSDEDYYGCDENALTFWDPDDENHKQQNNVEGDSNFELIPDLAKCMQKHQKEGFQFLWRCLDGQGSDGTTCFEKGGCVLSHAPGTGKTFLIISFLQSYMKVRF